MLLALAIYLLGGMALLLVLQLWALVAWAASLKPYAMRAKLSLLTPFSQRWRAFFDPAEHAVALKFRRRYLIFEGTLGVWVIVGFAWTLLLRTRMIGP